ncbi:Ig-like domain-containing protein [Flavobacterium sp.]|uniref:Ig-like domain-containing protein n=1 Tax=Flavobacterium sp. TaxID=239 RepID=UPI00286D96FA|nr:Ig-like domain-containing protein [Flavobacterium sp.]
MKKLKKLSLSFIVLLIVASCAKRGTITGGDNDILAPKITMSSPKNYTTNFDKNTIKITFDEYVKTKDVQKQLIVSPPMTTPLTISPQGSASKSITIKINDTLKANTTYSFNFGQSIVDFNEGNAFKQLKYVFSTGSFIDSLSVEGLIKDSYEKATENFVNVMLYEVDEKYNDSLIFKQTPRYVTNTLDSLKTFKIENIKPGQYKLVALKESSNNYKFDPNKDKIAFYTQTITVPDKSLFELELFKEQAVFKTKKPYQASSNRVVVGYEGNAKNIKIDTKFTGTILKTKMTKFPEKDSLQVWFKPIKSDSLQLNIENGKYKEEYVLKIKNQKQDTLSLSSKQTGIINLKDRFLINTSIPLEKFDLTKMSLIKKDSSKIVFTTTYDEFNQNLEIIFAKEPAEKYSLSFLPKAVEDYLGHSNDSINFNFSTKNITDYGNLKLNLQNAKSFPVIVELTDDKGKILATEYSETKSVVEFTLLEPRKYSVRLVYDNNKNKLRDTGNYLEKTQPEEVVHFPTEIDVRANWDVDQAFDLSLKPILKNEAKKEPVK